MPQTKSQEMPAAPSESHPSALTECERKVWQDHEWVLHDPEVQRAYAGLVVSVSNRTILGAGRTHLSALQAALARPDCPPRAEIATVPVEGVPLSVQKEPEGKERP